MTIPGIPINPLRQSDLDAALDAWVVTWDSIEAGPLPISRLPSVVARRDEANTFAQNQTFNGTINSPRAGNLGAVNPQNQIILNGGFAGYGVGFNANGELSTVVNNQYRSSLGLNLALGSLGAVQFNSASDLSGVWDSQIRRIAAGSVGVYQADGTTLGNISAGAITAPSIRFGTAMGDSILSLAGNALTWGLVDNGTQRIYMSGGVVCLTSQHSIIFSDSTTDSRSGLNTRISRTSSGVLQIGTSANNALGSLNLANLTASGSLTVSGGTVSTDGTTYFALRAPDGQNMVRGFSMFGRHDLVLGHPTGNTTIQGNFGLTGGVNAASYNISSIPILQLNSPFTGINLIGRDGSTAAGGDIRIRPGVPGSGSSAVIINSDGGLLVQNRAGTALGDLSVASISRNTPGGSLVFSTRNGGNTFTSTWTIDDLGVMRNVGAYAGANIELGGSYAIVASGLSRFDNTGLGLLAGRMALGNSTQLQWTSGNWWDTPDARILHPSTKTLATQVFESSLSAWQETERSVASASGPLYGVFGATPVGRQTLPAAATDLATTTALCNAMRSALIAFGFCN